MLTTNQKLYLIKEIRTCYYIYNQSNNEYYKGLMINTYNILKLAIDKNNETTLILELVI